MIVIVDYGMGNLGSIANMLKKIGASSLISSDIKVIENAEKLILPGVGAFDNGMKNLHTNGLVDILNYKVITQKTPVLGICLGMQLLTKSSEEGTQKGLGWVDADTIKFNFPENTDLKIPHMGWNTINISKESALNPGLDNESRFYFVHSYYVKCNEPDISLYQTHFGISFTSAVQKDNIYGVQFHPEKSHKYGMQLLKNFNSL